MKKTINKNKKYSNFAGNSDSQESSVKAILDAGIKQGLRTHDQLFNFVFTTLKQSFGPMSSKFGVDNIEQFLRDNQWILNRIQPRLDAYFATPAGKAEIAAEEAKKEALRVAQLATQTQTDTVAANKRIIDTAAALKIKALEAEAANPPLISKTMWLVIGSVVVLSFVTIVIIKQRKK